MTTLQSETEPTAARVIRHMHDLLVLAWPVMLSRAGILVMAFVDIAMLGRYGPGAIGVLNLGLAIFIPVLVVSIGLASGMVPVISHAFGAGQWEECGRAWRRAMSWGVFVSVIGVLFVWNGAFWLGLFGQTPELALAGGDIAIALAPGLIGQTVFAVCAFYLEATGRPFRAFLAMVFANLINAALNWVMIFGNLGFPELGAEGAAWASTIARFACGALMIWFVLGQVNARGAGVWGPWPGIWGPGGWRAGVVMRKLGFSAGVSNGFETFGFAAMMLFAGTLGTAALDAYSISHNLVSTAFMIGLGLAMATGVRVGQATGAGDPGNAVFAGWTGLGATVLIMGAIGVLVLIFRDVIVLAYTDEPDLALRTAGVLAISALIFVPDAMQVVMGQAVRALGDVWVPLAIFVLGFFVLMIPLGWWLINGGGWDERGLVLAVIISCVLITGLLCWRFRYLTRRGR